MEYGIKNNRRGYVRVSGAPEMDEEQLKRNRGKFPVVLDPGLNKLTKTQFDHVKAKAARYFEPGSSGIAVLEEVGVPMDRGGQPQQPKNDGGKKAA